MPSLPLQIINTPERQHRRLLTELSPGHYELCLDNTTLEKLLTCPRAFEFYAIYGRDSGERDALNYGTCIHKALETFYLGGSLDDMIDVVAKHFNETPAQGDSWRNFDHALEAVKRYHKWRGQCPPWNAIEFQGKPMVEVPFKLKLFTYDLDGDEWKYPGGLIIKTNDRIEGEERLHADEGHIHVYWTGKIDLVIEHNGQPTPIDHKTTSIGGGIFWQSFQLSAQMMGYCWATQQLLGREVPGVIVDAIVGRKPTRTGLAHENEYQQYNYSQEQLGEWRLDTIDHIQRMLTYLFNGYFPKATAWCANKFGMCSYFPTCTMSNKVQPQILMSGHYTERTWDPLTH